jgi:hypothetical protein
MHRISLITTDKKCYDSHWCVSHSQTLHYYAHDAHGWMQGRTETCGRPRLVSLRPFKLIFCKYLFNNWVGAGETDFLLTFTFPQLCKDSRVETSVNWLHISELFRWHFSALGSCPAGPPLNPALDERYTLRQTVQWSQTGVTRVRQWQVSFIMQQVWKLS